MIESYKDPNQITSPDKFEEDVLAEQSLRPSSLMTLSASGKRLKT